MNRLMMIAVVFCLALELGGGAYAQGTLVFNNLGTNDGLVFLSTSWFGGNGVPLNQDVNFALLTGPPGGPLTLEHKWLLSDGSAKGINVGPGRFADPSASVFSISGVAPGGPAIAEVVAWTGNYNSIFEAADAGAGYGQSPGFGFFTGSAGAPPASLGMPQFEIRGVPEPGAMKLMSIGGIALWFLLGRPRRLEGLRCSTMRGSGLR